MSTLQHRVYKNSGSDKLLNSPSSSEFSDEVSYHDKQLLTASPSSTISTLSSPSINNESFEMPVGNHLPRLSLMEEIVILGLTPEGSLSSWNDNISYVLRACVIIELALRKRIRMIDDPARNRYDVSLRVIEVVDTTPTGDTILDEALSLMTGEKLNTIINWIDMLSGETWSFFDGSLQLKNVRERISKSLVEKDILVTEIHTKFWLFDVNCYPIKDKICQLALKNRINAILSPQSNDNDGGELFISSDSFPDTVDFKLVRTLAVICCAYGADVLDATLHSLDSENFDKAFLTAEKILKTISDFPIDFSENQDFPKVIANKLSEEVQLNHRNALYLEVVAGALQSVLRMDSLL